MPTRHVFVQLALGCCLFTASLAVFPAAAPADPPSKHRPVPPKGKKEYDANKFVLIGGISDDRQTVRHVRDALSAAGIPASMGGSRRSIGISVPPSERQHALTVLEDDARKHGYAIKLYRDPLPP